MPNGLIIRGGFDAVAFCNDGDSVADWLKRWLGAIKCSSSAVEITV